MEKDINNTRFKHKTKPLTDQQENNIKRLFYRGLRKGETVVDNTYSSIAKELDLPLNRVKHFIYTKL